MNREIKFRGKTSKGDWVHGWFYMQGTGAYIVRPVEFRPNIIHSVILDTVGQFTGLKDRNGVEIYEGDKVNAKWERASRGGYLQSSDSSVETSVDTYVIWHIDRWAYKRMDDKFVSIPSDSKLTVTGNIHQP